MKNASNMISCRKTHKHYIRSQAFLHRKTLFEIVCKLFCQKIKYKIVIIIRIQQHDPRFSVYPFRGACKD